MSVPAEQVQEAQAERPVRDAKTMSAPDMATLLQITERRLQQLAQEGHVVAVRRGAYAIVPSVQGYIRFLRETQRSNSSFKELLTKAQADKTIRELLIKDGRYVPEYEIEDGYNLLVQTFHSGLLHLVQTVRQTLTADAAQLVEDKVNRLLAQLAQATLAESGADDGGDDVEDMNAD